MVQLQIDATTTQLVNLTPPYPLVISAAGGIPSGMLYPAGSVYYTSMRVTQLLTNVSIEGNIIVAPGQGTGSLDPLARQRSIQLQFNSSVLADFEDFSYGMGMIELLTLDTDEVWLTSLVYFNRSGQPVPNSPNTFTVGDNEEGAVYYE